jgi:hypothetical protein
MFSFAAGAPAARWKNRMRQTSEPISFAAEARKARWASWLPESSD